MAKGEVLSQNQIDAMLSAINSGSATVQSMQAQDPKSTANLYDFRHPARFSREHIQSLHALHETFSRLLSTQFSTQMRLSVHIEVASVDQLTYEEFMRSITNPTVVLLYQLLPLEGSIIFELTPATAISMIERMLGGPGRYLGKPRELTDIEQSLITNLLNKGMQSYQEAWRNIIPDLHPELHAMETNPRFVQIAGANDSVLVISFEIKVGESVGSMRVCIPYPTIEPVIAQLSHLLFQSIGVQHKTEELKRSTEEMRKIMDNVEVRLSLLLGHADITVSDLIGLQIGDVISLDSQINQDLPIAIEEEYKFWGRPGLAGKQMAAQITSIVDEG